MSLHVGSEAPGDHRQVLGVGWDPVRRLDVVLEVLDGPAATVGRLALVAVGVLEQQPTVLRRPLLRRQVVGLGPAGLLAPGPDPLEVEVPGGVGLASCGHALQHLLQIHDGHLMEEFGGGCGRHMMYYNIKVYILSLKIGFIRSHPHGVR